jgi:hypothetical protein
MVAMRSTAFNSSDLADDTQNSFALLRCVWDQLVSIRIRIGSTVPVENPIHDQNRPAQADVNHEFYRTVPCGIDRRE